MAGLVAVTTCGALMGYGRMATRTIAPLLTRHFALRCLSVIGLTLLVHIPMQASYVFAAHALSPQTSIADLIAASAIVMFATSVPISLAGWGMRELSAVVGLGAIGVPAHAALAAAVAVGIGSILVVGILAAAVLGDASTVEQPAQAGRSIDYNRVLAWLLPIGAATLVFFQVYVPVQSGLLNVNLADPLAILAGGLLVLGSFRLRQLPRWRVTHINLAVATATVVLAVSLLIGAQRFGWTNWAVRNRFLGWFVLLAYGATGALIVRDGGEQGLRTILLTFAGGACAIAGLEAFLVILAGLGIRVPVVPTAVQGFSLNHNFFAFQLLMAMCAAMPAVHGRTVRMVVFSSILTGLYFAGSRSGWIGAIFVLATGGYLGAIRAKEILIALVAVTGVAVFVAVDLPGQAAPHFVPDVASTQERLTSIVGGVKLFLEHPVFGAGLGAFRNELIPASSGLPLLIHSTTVWLLAELGIVGLAAFVAPFAFVFFREWKFARSEKASTVVILCLVAFAVMSAPADMLYQRTFWLLIGAGLALRRAE